MPIRDFRLRVERLRSLARRAGRTAPAVGALPFVVPARSTEEALRHIDATFLSAMTTEADRRWMRPDSGAFQTADDLDGVLLYGTPERVVAGVRRLQDAGASHVVFDLRLRFAAFDEVLTLVGERILPELRRGDRTVRAAAEA